MYTTLRTFYIMPESGSELRRRIRAHVEPLIRGLPGFVGYYLLEVSADKVTSVSIFDSKGHADIASGPTSFWMRDALGDYGLGLPEIISGQTDVYSSVETRSSHSDCQQEVMEPLMGII
jgi:hypothetical protein